MRHHSRPTSALRLQPTRGEYSRAHLSRAGRGNIPGLRVEAGLVAPLGRQVLLAEAVFHLSLRNDLAPHGAGRAPRPPPLRRRPQAPALAQPVIPAPSAGGSQSTNGDGAGVL
eukprot:3468385-Pyramimonas_sp.AAC.1